MKSKFSMEKSGHSSGQTAKTMLVYESSNLKNNVVEMHLPLDYPRSSHTGFEAAIYEFDFSPELREEVHRFSQREGAARQEILLAGFQALMYRYSGEEKITAGVQNVTQSGNEDHHLVFHSQVVETNVDDRDSFYHLVKEVRENLDEAYIMPFTKSFHGKQENKDSDSRPLFQVRFSMYQTDGNEPKEMENLLKKETDITHLRYQTDLNLVIRDRSGNLAGSLIYDKRIFKEEKIARITGHYTRLLSGALLHPDCSVTLLPILSEEERHTMVVEWNRSEFDYPRDLTIHQLFEEQVKLYPDKPALVFGNAVMTYSELDKRANQIANCLLKAGIEKEQLVAICLDRSLDMIASFLGVLKAGGAYVPIDLSYPEERVAYMMEDANVSLLITTASVADRLPAVSAKVIHLDRDMQGDSFMLNQVKNRNNPRNLAYVIYTSGSTGKPKGVAIVHQGISRLVKNISYAQVGSEETCLNLAQVSFDLSVYEIYSALLNGGKLVLIESNKPSFEEVAETIKNSQVTSLCVTPDRLNLLLEDFLPSLGSLRQILSAGEALPVWLAHKCLSLLPDCKLINLYGPTENSVTTTSYQVKEVSPDDSSVSIGRPISGDAVYILDKHLQPVPAGVIGELYLAGDGIAKGYLNKPELTEERFPLNPFSADKRSRMYKTGDLARYYSDGNIEFIRRADDQVKIRGYRIELGEIETAVGLIPGIRQSIAGTAKGRDGTTELVSYVVMNKGIDFDYQSIRSHLQKKLPQHMVPTFIVELEEMPVTPVGKIDRKRLPVPVASTGSQQIVAPRDKVEEQLVQIWEMVLDIHPIGVKQHFFELGGNSLMAMRMLAEIEKKFAKKLPVSILFQQDTIEELAEHLSADQPAAEKPQSMVAIQSSGSRLPLFCVHGGGGEVFIYRGIASGLGEDQPVYGLRYANEETDMSLSVELLAEQYLKEIKEVQPKGPYFLLGFCFGGAIAYEIAQKLMQEKEEVSLLTILNFENPAYTPVEDPYHLSYRMIVQKNLRQLYSLPLKQQAAFFVQKAQNALKLVQQNHNPIQSPVAEQPVVTKAALTRAMKRYRPAPYAGRLLLIRAGEDKNHEGTLGWETTSHGEIYLHSIAAEHETLMKEPHVNEVASCLKKYL